MLDNDRIGMFITKRRREFGLTQKELADKIGVSDKTVSKWETGRGLPDMMLLPEISRVLEVDVNELLSGEILEAEKYKEKAEQNAIMLISQADIRKGDMIKTITQSIVGFVIIIIIFSLEGVWRGININGFIDIPSILFSILSPIGIMMISGKLRSLLRGISVSLRVKRSDEIYSENELVTMKRSIKYAGILFALSGVFISLFDIIITLYSGIKQSTEVLFVDMGLSLLPLFYGLILTTIMIILYLRFLGSMEKYM